MPDTPSSNGRIAIVRLADLERAGRATAPLIAGIDAIFFATATHTFATEADRTAFRELWLDQYLERDRNHVLLALAADDVVAGYLVGCLDNPAASPRFASLGYFRDFAGQCRDFPAHLHVNLAAPFRNRGIGARLIDAFAADVATAGLCGLHVVTGAAARNVGFYTRLGFSERARVSRNDRELVFLGRAM